MGNTPSSNPLGTQVHFGADSNNWRRVVGVDAVWSYLKGAETTPGDYEREIALVLLSEPIVDEAYAVKPQIIDMGIPTQQNHVWSIAAGYAGWGIDETGVLPTHRRVANYSNPYLKVHHLSFNAGFAEWVAKWEDLYFGPDSGDSGGPLFYLPNENEGMNPREVIGVLTQRHSVDNEDNSAVWADITAEPLRNWLNEVAADPDRPGKWIGETDYVGPCDRTGDKHDGQPDADCDRWFDVKGHDNCPGAFNPEQTAGPDEDEDGVVDECDNCPTEGSYEQTDADGDGVGDACDFCQGYEDFKCCTKDSDCHEPSWDSARCIPYNKYVDVFLKSDKPRFCNTGMRCSESEDFDGDVVGDRCDNCPKESNRNQADSDNDGVGDACDNCSGAHSFGNQSKDVNPACNYSAATANADCVSLSADPGSICVPPHDGHVARCSKMPDADGDGLGDACDSCPHKQNGWQENCNIDIEIEQGVPYPYVGDACDPNPCSYSDVTFPDRTEETEGSNDVWNRIELDTVLLPKSEPGAFSYDGIPSATVGMRTCKCELPDGQPLTPSACKSKCRLDWNEYDALASNWKRPSVYHDTSGWRFRDPADPATFNQHAEFEGVPLRSPNDVVDPAGVLKLSSASHVLAWDVSKDYHLEPDIRAGLGSQVTKAVVWTHVKEVQGMPPGAAPAFRPRSNHYIARVFGRAGVDPTPRFPKQPFGPWSVWPEGCPVCELSPDRPLWEIDPIDERVVIRGRDFAVDVSERVSPAVRAEVVSPNRVWVAVEEGDRWVLGDAMRFASLSPDATTVGVVGVSRGGGLQEARRKVLRGFDPAASELASGLAPSPRTRFGAVLSASENALFVVGGIGDGERPTGDLWQYDPPTGTWFGSLITGAQPQAVLAATIRPENRALYVVDEIKSGSFRRARLLEIDLATKQSRMVGTWPRNTSIDSVFLSTGPDGQLVLVGSSSSRRRYAGVVFHPQNLKLPSLESAFSGDGVLGLKPTLDTRGLTLPMTTNTGVVNTFRPRDQLSLPLGFDIGSCL